MPGYDRNMHQLATYWQPVGHDLFNRKVFIHSLVKCRWEDTITVIVDKNGKEIRSATTVFLPIPVDLEGFLALGDHSDTDPTLVDGASEIKQLSSIPDLRNLRQLYTAYL